MEDTSNLRKLRSEFERAFSKLPKVSLRLAALIVVLGICRSEAGEEQAPMLFVTLVIAAGCLIWEASRAFHRLQAGRVHKSD